MAGHLQEFKAQLVSVLAADATLTALLSSTSAIFYRRIPGVADYPALFYAVETAYRPEVTREGIRKLAVRFTAIGDDPDALDQIENALEVLLDANPSVLSSANWTCKRLKIESSEPQDVDRFDPDTTEVLWSNVITFEAMLYAN